MGAISVEANTFFSKPIKLFPKPKLNIVLNLQRLTIDTFIDLIFPTADLLGHRVGA